MHHNQSILKILFVLFSTIFIFSGNAMSASKPLNINLKTPYSLTGHPILDGKSISPALKNLVYAPLFKFGRNWKANCEICAEQPSFENELVEISRSKRSHGKISVEIILNENAKWADGVSISGHDIVFSWKVGAAYSKKVKYPSIYDRIESISVPRGRPKVAIILLKGAFYQNKILDDFYIIPRHLEQPIWEKSGKRISQYKSASLYVTDPENSGLYYSSYNPLKVRKNQITLTQNRFALQKPVITKVIIEKGKGFKSWADSSPNTSSAFVNEGISNPKFIAHDKDFSNSNLYKTHARISTPSIYWEQAVFNQRNPILTDKKVRKAILHAINWQKIASIAGHNNIMTTATFEPPYSPYFLPANSYLYSPKLSKQLLKSAGWIKSKTSNSYIKGDEKLEFNMVVLKDNRLRVKIAELVAKNLEEVGFNVSLYPKSKSFLMNRVIKEGRFTGLAFYGIKMETNIAPRTLFHSQEIPSSLNDYLGQNVGVWYSKDIDNTLDNLRISISQNKREKYFKSLQKHYLKDIPSISFFYHKNFNVIPHSLKIANPTQGKNILTSLAKWKFRPNISRK